MRKFEHNFTSFDDFHTQVGSCVYWGKYGTWVMVAGQHRDSDCLERSNFQVMLKLLGGESKTVVIERESHWAVGWVEHILIKPTATAKLKIAFDAVQKIKDYPVLGEEHFSQLESDEANEIWRNCYNPKERVEYIRKHKSEFSFHNFIELLHCVRGLFFGGLDSELIT